MTHACTSLDLGAEGIGVALQNGLHSGLAGALILHVVAAVDTVAAITITARGEALAVPADNDTLRDGCSSSTPTSSSGIHTMRW